MTDRAKVTKTDSEWKEQLGETSFEVLRNKVTERPYTGDSWDEERPGTYRCKGCATVLFEAGAKFDAGCGWPSFFAPATEGVIDEESDATHGMARTEVLCSGCDGHLGHVFPDGPAPTGLRYCINSASIDFEPLETP